MRDITVKVRTAAGKLLFLLAFGLLLSVAPALAEEYAGKVVGTTDGDTLTLLTPEKRQLKVHLAEIGSVMCGWPPTRKSFFDEARWKRLQSCVRPIDAVDMTAGPDGFRGSRPNQICGDGPMTELRFLSIRHRQVDERGTAVG